MCKADIRIKVNGGYIIAYRNDNRDYDGITIMFEADDGTLADIIVVESKSENDYKQTDVYCYEDVSSDEFTHKFTIDHEKIF